ncbi:hypothetical protein IW15_08525 [Chryseobacterium soli]|uniref:HTH tetR-type domain-containing protein n=2 Tax=Chryseobacterium soli TaxID=445961 RepID=A0A086A808_9FLAO|nr:hypothetical protein IW15_08525 [Chryseobacterium soli]
MDKREQIIMAAMKLLVERGIQATPMSAIAKAAGTGMGTIYNYFATKEDLINAIYLHIKTSEINQTLKNIPADASVKSKFLGYYTSFVTFYLKFPESFTFIDQMQNSPVIKEETKIIGKNALLPVYELIIKGQQDGIIKKYEIESMLNFLGGTITTFVRWRLGNNNIDAENQLEQQLKMVWDAVKD